MEFAAIVLFPSIKVACLFQLILYHDRYSMIYQKVS